MEELSSLTGPASGSQSPERARVFEFLPGYGVFSMFACLPLISNMSTESGNTRLVNTWRRSILLPDTGRGSLMMYGDKIPPNNMRSAINWQCPSCDTPLRAETGGHGCFPFPQITCPVCGSLQEKRLGVGLYTLAYYDKTGKAWTSFQYRGAPTKDPSRNASES